jgi:hypothetical protein
MKVLSDKDDFGKSQGIKKGDAMGNRRKMILGQEDCPVEDKQAEDQPKIARDRQILFQSLVGLLLEVAFGLLHVNVPAFEVCRTNYIHFERGRD